MRQLSLFLLLLLLLPLWFFWVRRRQLGTKIFSSPWFRYCSSSKWVKAIVQRHPLKYFHPCRCVFAPHRNTPPTPHHQDILYAVPIIMAGWLPALNVVLKESTWLPDCNFRNFSDHRHRIEMTSDKRKWIKWIVKINSSSSHFPEKHKGHKQDVPDMNEHSCFLREVKGSREFL